jgi:prefoldin subunit 5
MGRARRQRGRVDDLDEQLEEIEEQIDALKAEIGRLRTQHPAA